ncbi:MAG TPA: ABC transporter substrate-binding protein [Longimicrobiaceae bacterium]|nr:ABC transporter substrate-binding protein [Longimicrobiaceae bacterium]
MRAFRSCGFITIGLTLLLTACGGDEGTDAREAAGDPVPGGTAVFGILTDFQAFNPVTNTNLTTFDVMKQMLFTPIIKYDESLEVKPHLAESWELTDTSVVFHLRNDVMWHDGVPVTAEDVKFTFDLAKSPETASLLGAAYLNMVDSATVIDSHTVRFDFVAPHAQALEDFWWSPLPSHLLENVAPAELARAPFNRTPVGSGPFKFVSWENGQQLTLEANDSFPEALGGRPYLDRFVFRVIPEPTTMVTELLSGSADVIGYTLLPDQAAQIAQQGGVELRHFPSREFTYIGWNSEREMFRDPRVRRALTMAMNRGQIITALMHGYAVPAHGMIPPWSPMYSDIEPLPYNPTAARQLLAQAGWTDSNGDGIVEREGQPLQFVLLLNTANRMHQDIATVLQSQLREVGAAVELRTIEFQTMLQQHKARDYDAVMSNWTLDTFRVDPTPLFSCEQARTPMSANRAGYCNPAADELMAAGLREVDPAEAKRIWAEFSKLIQQDQPITFLFWSEDLAGVGPRLHNVDMDVRSKLVTVGEWWIPADRQR